MIVSISRVPLMKSFFSGPSPNPVLHFEVNKNKEVVSFRMNMIKIYKISMMAATIVAIMLVDFPQLFGRFMCKTEDKGWSLMDVGVSSVMYAAGIGHRLVVTHPSAKTNRGFISDLKAILMNVPNNTIIFSASLRYFLLKGIDYHEHVSEWGVHWNFYLSMAMFNII